MKKQISLLLVALGLSLSNGAQAGFYGPASRTTRQVTPFVSRYLARPGGLSQGAINAARTYARQPMQQQFSMPAARTFATKAPEIAARPNYSYWWQQIKNSPTAKWIAGFLAGGTLIGTGSVKAEEESEAERDSRFKAEQSLYFKNLLGQGIPENVREFHTNRLLIALYNGNIDELRDAIANGADINNPVLRNPDGGSPLPSKTTPLMLAAHRNNERVVRELINAGADINAKDGNGNTALMEAAKLGNLDTTRELIRNRAFINAKNKNGRTALMMASMGNSDFIVKLLVRAGADVNVKDEFGRTALDYAKKYRKSAFIDILLQYGAKE